MMGSVNIVAGPSSAFGNLLNLESKDFKQCGKISVWIFSKIYLFTAKAQRTQRLNYFLFSGERLCLIGREERLVPLRTIGRPPENKKNQLYIAEFCG